MPARLLHEECASHTAVNHGGVGTRGPSLRWGFRAQAWGVSARNRVQMRVSFCLGQGSIAVITLSEGSGAKKKSGDGGSEGYHGQKLKNS